MTLLRTALGALRALAHAVAETRHERTRARAQAMRAEADAAYHNWITAMSQTGPVPDSRTCHECDLPISWLWSPRVHDGLGGWVKYERVSDDGYTIRSHRCRPPLGEFDYQGGETPSVEPAV